MTAKLTLIGRPGRVIHGRRVRDHHAAEQWQTAQLAQGVASSADAADVLRGLRGCQAVAQS